MPITVSPFAVRKIVAGAAFAFLAYLAFSVGLAVYLTHRSRPTASQHANGDTSQPSDRRPIAALPAADTPKDVNVQPNPAGWEKAERVGNLRPDTLFVGAVGKLLNDDMQGEPFRLRVCQIQGDSEMIVQFGPKNAVDAGGIH
jgi:hypothetical protein